MQDGHFSNPVLFSHILYIYITAWGQALSSDQIWRIYTL